VFEGLVTALINEPAAAQPSEDEALLVIDDCQLIGVQVHASLEFLLTTRCRACTWCWPAAPIRRRPAHHRLG
jgi:hypothetical protein